MTTCPYGVRKCMCQFCERQCNNGFNCAECKQNEKAVHEIYLCTGFEGDLDLYINYSLNTDIKMR